MKSILLIGDGKWGNTVLAFIIKNKLFDLIYVKSRKKIFLFKKKIKTEIKNLPNINTISVVHICTPLSTHYRFVKKFLGHDNLIIEKPFLKNLRQFSKIKKKIDILGTPRVIVNYIDLYNPIINLIKKKLKNKFSKIVFEYSNPKSFFKKKYLCIEDWLEHPLSLILLLFKKFTKFKIITNDFVYKKKNFLEKIKIQYLFKKKTAIIEINLKNSKKRGVYLFKENKLIFFANLKSYKTKNKNDSLFYLYNSLLSKNKLFYQSLDFYKKILAQRISILDSL
jgi:hypothetical protein